MRTFTKIAAFSLVLALLALCAGVGRFALTQCRVTLNQPLEALSFSTALGAGLVATSILVCGLLSALEAPVLGLLVLVWAFLARKELGALPSLCAQSWSVLRTRTGVVGLSIAGAIGLFMISQALAPPIDWDSLMYHLRVPAQFAQEGRVYLTEDNLNGAFVGLVHMLYVPLLALGSSAGPALVSAVLALLLGAAVLAFCVRFLDGPTSALSLSLLSGSTILLLTAITARVDVTLAFYVFLAHYALLMALSESSRRAYFYLSAVLLGLAVGIKYLALAYVLALGPLILWVVGSPPRRLAASVRALVVFALLFIGGALPWLAKNWILFGAPLYPYLAERRMDPWLAALYGDGRIPPTVNPEAFAILSHIRAPFNLLDLFLAPARLTVESEAALYVFNPILLALPLLVVFARNRAVNWLAIPALVYGVLVVMAFPATNLRYLIPAIAPLTIVTASVAVRLVRRVCPVKVASVLVVLLAALALVPVGKTMYLWLSDGWLSDGEPWRYLTGASSGQEYLGNNLPPYADNVAFVNRYVPKDGHILMLFDARGYYFHRRVIQDSLVTNWSLLAPKTAGGDCLREAGITHVLINWASAMYYVYRGVDAQVFQLPALREFAQRCLTRLHERGGLALYELKR